MNNAGHNFVGGVELTTMRQYLMVANINVYGMVRTTKAFLPLLRQARGEQSPRFLSYIASDTRILKIQQHKRKTYGLRTFSCFESYILEFTPTRP